MTVRESFVAHFGEENATKVEEASIGHINDAASKSVHEHDNWSSEPFRYHLMNCISHECFTNWSEFHGFGDLDVEEVRKWAVEHADLHEFDGDMPDYLGLVAGAYSSWLNWERMGQEEPEGWKEHDKDQERWRGLSVTEMTKEVQDLTEQAMRLLNHHDPKEEK